MVVELISVGTELLLGNIVNTNAAYLSERCADLGLSCFYQSVVGDNEERLTDVIKTALKRSDILILSGGLGPTADDLTKEVAAKVMGRELIMHEPSRKLIEEFFNKKGSKPTENNWKQAMMPKDAIVVDNENGTAPGVIIEAEGKKVILLPGPPNELIPMFEKNIVPYLSGEKSGIIYSRTVKICGVGESKAETMVKDLIDGQTNPTIAPYAKNCEVHLRVTAKAADEKEAKALLTPVLRELTNRFGANIYSMDKDTTLEKAVVDLLLDKNLTVSTAESCTGGMLAARLINVPGISNVYKSGYITYSNKAKRKILGVKQPLLENKGAVSKETAEAMAKGAAAISKSDVAVAVTGIAGPDGGTDEKPVGLVYIACNVRGKITVKKYNLSGNRAKIRETTVSCALILMRQCILKYDEEVAGGKR
ncbi:MAG: competence/damage-inducible protein A [Clostridiales bacterium]|nr:competence/damage-inducible protein A [Clostridiales bacterium]